MLAPHMGINAVTARKRLHAHPTNVGLTHCAFHVIASIIFLNRNVTTGASLNIALARPFLEHIVSVFKVGTGKSVVCICLAGWANPHKATWALQKDTFWGRAEYLRAIGSGTILKFFRMSLHVSVKCSSHRGVEIGCRQHFLGSRQRNSFSTFSLVAQTCQRKEFLFTGGGEIVLEASPTPRMTASHFYWR